MNIDRYTMDDVTLHVEGVLMTRPEGTVIHTVTITINGAHGGSDVVIEGVTPNKDDSYWLDDEEFTERFIVK